MLAIISDLHFCDNSATDRNVRPAAFQIALDDIYQSAAALAEKTGTVTRLDLVFLGDVFDFLRTERWFEELDGTPVPLEERPWGAVDALDETPPPVAVLARVHRIFDAIVQENQAALRILRDDDKPRAANVEVRRIFLPGNHDRLVLHDPLLLERCRSALGAVDPVGLEQEGIYPHHLAMSSYGLLARHGHEWDDWNFERYRGAAPSEYGDRDYLPTPIGDPITTELAARLPYELRKQLRATSLTAGEQDDVIRRMQRIDDVRPLLAAFHWAFYEASQIKGDFADSPKGVELSTALNDTVRLLARDFLDLPFYAAWKKRHRKLLHLDSAAELQLVLDGLSSVTLHTVETVAQLFERFIESKQPRDTCRDGAALEELRALGDQGLRFVVYGHTHEPLQVALRAGVTRDMYLNTGTFRKAVFRTDDQRGFLGWERMTYLMFFTEQERRAWDPAQLGPTCDAWTGTRSA